MSKNGINMAISILQECLTEYKEWLLQKPLKSTYIQNAILTKLMQACLQILDPC